MLALGPAITEKSPDVTYGSFCYPGSHIWGGRGVKICYKLFDKFVLNMEKFHPWLNIRNCWYVKPPLSVGLLGRIRRVGSFAFGFDGQHDQVGLMNQVNGTGEHSTCSENIINNH